MTTTFKVYNESTCCSEREVYFKLKSYPNGDVSLFACDKDGERHSCGNIITIQADGTLRRPEGVNTNLGLQLTPNGEIALYKKY